MVDRLFADADLAALYDAMCPRDQRPDFDFYLPLVMDADAVLDVGCGTGAMLHEARDAGHRGRLCGLDPAAGMLAQARKRPDIEWVLSDLTSAGFDAEFDLVVMTGHAFQALVEDETVATALSAIQRALRADGRFAFETRNPLARAWEAWTADNPVPIAGSSVRMTRQVTAPFDGRTVSFTHTFVSPDWDRPQISRSTLRFLDAAALSAVLAAAGLEIVEQFGDWDRRPLTEAGPEIITTARPSRPQRRG